MPNKLLVRNPYLNEFIWDILYNLTAEQRKKLSTPFLKIAKSPIKSKNFSEFSTLDEKARFWSELGLEFGVVFFQDKVGSVNGLKVILEKYEKERSAAAAKNITELKIFVSSDKQVKWLLGMMADSCHHKSYFLNQDYNKVGHHIKNWSKKLDTKDTQDLSENLEGADLVAKTMLGTLISKDFVDSFVGVGEFEIMVLFYLFEYKHTYKPKEIIQDYFVGSMTKGKTTSCLKRLFLNGHIRKHVDYRKPQYTLTASGIGIVMDFMQRVLKQNNF